MQNGDVFDVSASGVLLMYMFEYFADMLLDIKDWFNMYVDLYPSTNIWEKFQVSPMIVKFFSEYHVMLNGKIYICGHASVALEKWLRLKLSPDTIKLHFEM